MMAFIPDAHTLLIVVHGVDTGNPYNQGRIKALQGRMYLT